MKYRSEIDGLRALAVVPVILFHAGFQLFSGGYVGVDVFFVISGYLITTILINELEDGKFSIVNFYERRARRILPALFLVMATCIPMAWVWITPSQMVDFSNSLIAVSIFASNILFWSESGYFDLASEEKPLLHTWSLAVEEQYYVLFPIFLLLVWRFGREKVFWMIAGGALVSLLASEWGWRNEPTANFYLAPTRAWELFAGSIAAFIASKHGVKKNDALSLLGLMAVVFSIFAFDATTPFPSVYALVPVLGVVLLILFGGEGTIAARILSWKVFVGIGLISYSAYLWHQPLFAFARIRLTEHPSQLVMGVLSLASIALAALSWRYVENPFRNKQKVNRQKIFTLSLAGIVLFVGLGFLLPRMDTLRYDAGQLAIMKDGTDNRHFMETGAYDISRCFMDHEQGATQLLALDCVKETSGERTIIFGDSEAAHLFEGFRSVFGEEQVMQFSGTSCRAIDFSTVTPRCKEFYDLFVSEIVPTLSQSDTVIVSSNWINTYKDVGADELKRAVMQTLSMLKETGASVYILTNAPEFYRSPYETMAFASDTGSDVVRVRSRPIYPSDRVIEEAAAEIGVDVFNVSEGLCDEEYSCLFKDANDYLFFDTGHFSYYGSRLIAERFRSQFVQR